MIDAGGYYEKITPLRDRLRKEEIKNLTEFVAKDLGFDLIKFQYDEQMMILDLCTRIKGIDQDSELLVGRDIGAEKYTIRMKYIDLPIIEQIVGLFQRVYHQLQEYFELIANIQNVPVSEKYGRRRNSSTKSRAENIPDIQQVRNKFKVDTPGNQKMIVLFESLSIEEP